MVQLQWGMIMKKENIYKFFYIVCLFLIIGFAIRLRVDYFSYDNTNHSAPLYAFIIVRAVEFIVPGMIVFITGKGLKKKYSK